VGTRKRAGTLTNDIEDGQPGENADFEGKVNIALQKKISKETQAAIMLQVGNNEIMKNC